MDYFEHYALLVGGIYRLLQSSISTKDLQEATLLLKLFCAKVPGYYGKSCHNPVLFFFFFLSCECGSNERVLAVMQGSKKVPPVIWDK